MRKLLEMPMFTRTLKQRAEKWAEKRAGSIPFKITVSDLAEAYVVGFRAGKKDCPIMCKLDKGVLEQKLVDELGRREA